jgi:hypothetical protein
MTTSMRARRSTGAVSLFQHIALFPY